MQETKCVRIIAGTLLPVLLGGGMALAGEKTSVEEITATSCMQDMSCERPVVGKSEIASVRASSTLKGTRKNPGRYAAVRVLDDDEKTAWCEGKKGPGEGERLVIELKQPVTIDGVLVSPMYARSIPVAKKNNRVTSYTLDFGVRTIRVTSAPYTVNTCGPPPMACPEVNAPQQVRFEPLETSKVTLTIEAVERGTRYDDTCISTLHLLEPDTR